MQDRQGDRGQDGGAPDARQTSTVFKGQITSVEPEFNPNGCNISIRAYDNWHKMNRQRKTRTFQQMSAADMVREGRERSRPVRRLRVDTAPSTSSSSRATRPTGTSAWRLAIMEDFEVVVEDQKLNFRKANQGQRHTRRAYTVRRHADDLPPARERHPAGELGRGPRLGPEGQAGRQRQREQSADHGEGRTSSAAQVSSDSGGGKTAVKDRFGHDGRTRPTRSRSRPCSGWLTRSSRPTAPRIGNPALKAGSEGQGRRCRLEVRRRVRRPL